MKKSDIVTLCGSTRFKDRFFEVAKELTCAGYIVLSPFHFRKCGDKLTPELEQLLESLHFQKIDMSNEIFVINVGGYLGDSTRKEIAYAQKIGVKVRYLEP